MAGLEHDEHTRARVIEEFARVGRVDLACASVGVARGCHYLWLKQFPDYAKAFADAREQATQLLRDEAFRRAYKGTMRPVSIGGKVHIVTEFSDTLLMFLLEAHDPKTFGRRVKSDLRFVDQAGNDRALDVASVRAYMQQAPEDGEQAIS